MSLPRNNSTHLAFSWEDSLETIDNTASSTVYGTSPSFSLNHTNSLNNLTPGFQPSSADLSVLDAAPNMTRPYTTNWSFFENYNPSVSLDHEIPPDLADEPSYRVRMSSMTSSASSQSYTLCEDRGLNLPITQPEASEGYLDCNLLYQLSPQSDHDSVYACHYNQAMTSKLDSTSPNQPQQSTFGRAATRSFNRYPDIYFQSYPKDYTTKVPTYCLNRPFKCEICGSSFSRNHDLKRHSRIHLDVKPFPCTSCDKAFARKDALKRHLLVKGCSKSKQSSTGAIPTSSDGLKLLGPPSTLAGKYVNEQAEPLWPNPTQSQRAGYEKKAVLAGDERTKSSGNVTTGHFSEIKLQNIKCLMPTFT